MERNIYKIGKELFITSDEEIKLNEWYENNGVIFKADAVFDEGNNPNNSNPRVTDFNKKIILTTDIDLIKDGIQEIDDEFLEWFVNNPSCEWVEVEKQLICENCGVEDCNNFRCRGYDNVLRYKIIISQEEPKQETLTYTEAAKKEERIFNTKMIKQETLEEAAENYCSNSHAINEDRASWQDIEFAFKDGAEWQAERMYSEEEVIKIVEKSRETGLTAEYLLLTEQFKKK